MALISTLEGARSRPAGHGVTVRQILQGDGDDCVDGWGFSHMLHQAARVTTRAAAATGHVAAEAGKATGHVAAETGRAVGHVVMSAERLTARLAKRLIRGVAKSVLFGNNLLGEGDVPKYSKTAAIAALSAPAMAAVAASPASVATPLVPVLVTEVVNELYDQIKKLGPKAAKADLDNDLPPDDAAGTEPSKMPIIIGAGIAAAIVLYFVMKRK